MKGYLLRWFTVVNLLFIFLPTLICNDVVCGAYLAGPVVVPELLGSSIVVKKGMKIHVELVLVNGKVVDWSIVRGDREESHVLTIELSSVMRDSVERTMLSIYNPYNTDLTYNARIFLNAYDKWLDTDVIPVKPGLKAIEIWNDSISEVILSGFQLSPSTSPR